MNDLLNSLSSGRGGCYFKCVHFKNNLGIDTLGIQIIITLEWMLEGLVDG